MSDGSGRFRTPRPWVIGCVLILESTVGIVIADARADLVPHDLVVQDTYFVVAHFHHMLYLAVVFGFFAGYYYLFPRITNNAYPDALGRIYFCCCSSTPRRWNTLALVFAIRTVMAFQFQTIAALAPMLRKELGVSVAEIGFLIGIYRAPGIALALPGGAFGKRYGDRQVVIFGLALMTGGGLVMALSISLRRVLAVRMARGKPTE